MSSTPELILASTSPYRRELLARLRLPFSTRRPEVDETHAAGEVPLVRAERLAVAKAQAVSALAPAAVVIGSDQVASCEGRILDKPGNADHARIQLEHQSGRAVIFYSAVAVLWPLQGYSDRFVDRTTVVLRTLSAGEISAYLAADRPFDCAGSLRSEGLGIGLCERIESLDPTGLIGLPLIRLAASLRSCGYAVP